MSLCARRHNIWIMMLLPASASGVVIYSTLQLHRYLPTTTASRSVFNTLSAGSGGSVMASSWTVSWKDEVNQISWQRSAADFYINQVLKFFSYSLLNNIELSGYYITNIVNQSHHACSMYRHNNDIELSWYQYHQAPIMSSHLSHYLNLILPLWYAHCLVMLKSSHSPITCYQGFTLVSLFISSVLF